MNKISQWWNIRRGTGVPQPVLLAKTLYENASPNFITPPTTYSNEPSILPQTSPKHPPPSVSDTWWNKHAENEYSTFCNWIGDKTAQTKVYSAEYCVKQSYTSVLDLGCGIGTFYYTLMDFDNTIEYVGVDSCRFFVKQCRENGISILEEDICRTSLPDDCYEFVYSRHTWEHQPEFETILQEMVRLASKEACVVFFIKPQSVPTIIHYDKETELYHNIYSKDKIEEALSSIPKVRSWKWVDINRDEVVLHIQV